MSKKPEDMTIEEIKEQLAIYNRLYYHKRNKEEAYMQKKRESAQRHNQKKKIKEYEQANNITLKPEEINDELLSEILNAKKPMKPKHGSAKYDMKNCKIIMPMSE